MITDIVEKVSKQPGTLEDYEKLNILLRNLSPDELTATVSTPHLLEMFSHMDLNDNNISELALGMANIIFSTFYLTEFVLSHESELLMALSSPNVELRNFIISRLSEGIINSKQDVVSIPEKILLQIVKIAVEMEISQASSALIFLKTFALHNPLGVEILFGKSPMKDIFLTSKNDEHMIRISELFVGIAFESPQKLAVMGNLKCLDPLLNVFQTNDPLLQLNCIAVLKNLASFPEGLAFLQSRGTVDTLLSNLVSLEDNPLRDLVLPGYLSFFGEVSASDTAKYLGDLDHPTQFVKCLATSLNDSSQSTSIVALETIGFICRNPAGKQAISCHLDSNGLLSHSFPLFGSFMHSSPKEFQVRMIYALADFLRLSRSMSCDEAIPVAKLTWSWLGKISLSPSVDALPTFALKLFSRIWELAKQPFHEVRAAAFHLFEAIATEPWGISLFVQKPGFIEYLLNRSTELGLSTDTTSLLPAKFSIVTQTLLTREKYCDISSDWPLMDDETVDRLQDYVKVGQWGSIKSEAAVALEQG